MDVAYLIQVRDKLREAYGDHMVASTIFSKRLITIEAAYTVGIPPERCAKMLRPVRFAGDQDYETKRFTF